MSCARQKASFHSLHGSQRDAAEFEYKLHFALWCLTSVCMCMAGTVIEQQVLCSSSAYTACTIINSIRMSNIAVCLYMLMHISTYLASRWLSIFGR